MKPFVLILAAAFALTITSMYSKAQNAPVSVDVQKDDKAKLQAATSIM